MITDSEVVYHYAQKENERNCDAQGMKIHAIAGAFMLQLQALQNDALIHVAQNSKDLMTIDYCQKDLKPSYEYQVDSQDQKGIHPDNTFEQQLQHYPSD